MPGVPPVYRPSTGASSWQGYLNNAGAEELKMQLEIYNQLLMQYENDNPQYSQIAYNVVGDTITTDASLVGNAPLSLIGFNAVGDPVSIVTLLAAPAFSNAVVNEKISLLGAINNIFGENDTAQLNRPNITSNGIVINLNPGHGIVSVLIFVAPSNY